MSLAERLRLARQNTGLRQQQVTERCGIDDSSLSAFENGRSD
jgi:transcriptional regulator with XRE-family HTH domain